MIRGRYYRCERMRRGTGPTKLDEEALQEDLPKRV